MLNFDQETTRMGGKAAEPGSSVLYTLIVGDAACLLAPFPTSL